MNNQEFIISSLNAKLNKLHSKCLIKSKKIEAETNELESLNHKQEVS